MMKIINGPEVTAQLSAALKDIARLTGFSEREVTKGEVGQILKTWAGRTKAAKPEVADYRARKRALHDLGFTKAGKDATPGTITINTGTRGAAGRLWVKTAGKRGAPWRLGGKIDPVSLAFTPARFHWKKGDWTDIQEAAATAASAIKRAAPLARASTGLARQSIVQIADGLGIDLARVAGGGISAAQVAKARAAMASNGQTYINGTAQEQQAASQYFVTLINSLPYWPKIGMDRTLAGVIAGRAGLYRRTFANGAFQSIQSAARNYPWMRTQLQAA